MTVTYTAEVATCKRFGCFLKLLFRWKASIYKLVWMDLLAFLTLYYILNFVYRYALSPEQKIIFESVVRYCDSYGSLIPLSFVLGFFVQIVMQRWWEQYMQIPWPDSIAVFVSAHIHGQDDRARLMRRTIMRYVCLCLAIALTHISPRVKKRFPTLDQLVDAGLLLESERVILLNFNESFPKIPKHWMPIVWAAAIVTRARHEGRIRDDFAVKTIIDELNKFRGMCGLLMFYDLITIPLVYTQVVTLAVYSFFMCSVLGKQWYEGRQIESNKHLNIVDVHFPIFGTLQFFFYMGWLKVAETLINPFGDDDDDFEVNWMIDRDLQVSYLIVDEMHQEHPELVRDQYWDEIFPQELPYDEETKREEPPEHSTAKIGEGLDDKLTAVKVEDPMEKPESSHDIMPMGSAQQIVESQSSMRIRQTIQEFMRGEDNFDLEEQDEEDAMTSSGAQLPKALSSEKSQSLETDMDRTDDEGAKKDDFHKLRNERGRERAERQRLRFVRQISDASHVNVDSDLSMQSASSLTSASLYSARDRLTTTATESDSEGTQRKESQDKRKQQK